MINLQATPMHDEVSMLTLKVRPGEDLRTRLEKQFPQVTKSVPSEVPTQAPLVILGDP